MIPPHHKEPDLFTEFGLQKDIITALHEIDWRTFIAQVLYEEG